MSISTVSRTFTLGAIVEKQARANILNAAQKLGYRPNAIARTLSTRKSRMVALVVSYLHNQFYPTIIERLCKRRGLDEFHVLLFVSEDTISTETQTDALLLDSLSYQVDAIILASSLMSSKLAKRCRDSATPVVMFNRISKLRGVSTVASDNYAGGQLAARTLLSRGAKRLGFIAGLEQASTSIERERGFKEELALRGRSMYARDIGHYDLLRSSEATRRLFNQKKRFPDGIFVANEYMALGVVDVIRNNLGLRVPEDVQIIGFDNVPQSVWGGYQLSTIEQDAQAVSDAAMSLLMQQIGHANRTQPKHIVVPIRLVERQTTLTD